VKDTDISTPEQAEAALAERTLTRHRRLWQRAEGRAGWAYISCIVAAAVLLGVGLGGDIVDGDDRLFYIALGIVLFFQVQIIRAQSQSAAMRKLIDRLEERVTRVEKRQHSVAGEP
jgi:hypothetical protein